VVDWGFITRGHQPIGLDIGHDSIKMIQLATNAGHISVLAAEKVHIDPGINGDGEERRRFIVSSIRKSLASGSFHGRNVVSALPSESLKITSLRLAEVESAKLEQVLRKEVSERFGLDPDRDAIEYMLAGDVRQGDEIRNELILFAAKNESIRSHIELLEEAGLKPVSLDTTPCALFRSFERVLQRVEDRDRTAVFVDIGSRFTTVVFGRGREISFIKQIPIGGEKFNQEVATKLGVSVEEAQILRRKLRVETPAGARVDSVLSPAGGRDNGEDIDETVDLDASTRQVTVDAVSTVAQELAKEISLCFRYYTVTFRGKRVERAIFSGGEAYEKILLNVLKRQLAVEIEVAQPLRGFDMTNVDFDSDRRGLLCEWAVAVGLSLKGQRAESTSEKKVFNCPDNREG